MAGLSLDSGLSTTVCRCPGSTALAGWPARGSSGLKKSDSRCWESTARHPADSVTSVGSDADIDHTCRKISELDDDLAGRDAALVRGLCLADAVEREDLADADDEAAGVIEISDTTQHGRVS